MKKSELKDLRKCNQPGCQKTATKKDSHDEMGVLVTYYYCDTHEPNGVDLSYAKYVREAH